MTNPITEAIVLAGGLGTRLRQAVPYLPKCMAPIAGQPFINYVVDYLRQQGISRFIFSLGYKGEQIQQHIQAAYPLLTTVFVIEESPLGTGGAIQLAGKQVKGTHVAIVNGDTLFKVDWQGLWVVHHAQQAACTLALKPLQHIDRYGSITMDATGRVTHFEEKKWQAQALVNGGAYLLDVPNFLQTRLQPPASFEKDYLEGFCQQHKIYGQVQDTYFIDIGVPEDYERAKRELG